MWGNTVALLSDKNDITLIKDSLSNDNIYIANTKISYEVGGPELMTLTSIIGDSDCKFCQCLNK